VSARPTEAPNVLLLDLWSDKNRGDAAMQIALIQLVRRRLPDSRIVAMAAFGANQWPMFLGEFDETRPLVDDFVGGVRPWFLGPFDTGVLRIPVVRKVVNALAATLALGALPMLSVVGHVSWFDSILPVSWRRTIRALRSADLVLWNCRNIGGASTSSEIYEVWGRTYNALAAQLVGKPVACIGASIWPLRHRLSRFLTRTVLGKTIFVSVRDRESHEYMRSLLSGRTVVPRLLPDLSISVVSERVASSRELPPEPQTLGLTVVDWNALGPGARRRYIEALRGFLVGFLQPDSRKLVVIPQVTSRWESSTELEADLLRGLNPHQVTVVPGRPTVDELLVHYRNIDLLIATRMHSAVFALTQGTPVVTIPYTRGGKWGILEMMGVKDIDVPFEDISAETLSNKTQDVWARRLDLISAVRETLPRLANDVADNVNEPIDVFQSRKLRGS
jgi:polysaccharide pyruvyl transferase WcaK-like protein